MVRRNQHAVRQPFSFTFVKNGIKPCTILFYKDAMILLFTQIVFIRKMIDITKGLKAKYVYKLHVKGPVYEI